MCYIYPAVFYKEADGRYSVIFPDLNDLATYGNDFADAFTMAQEACGQYLFNELKEGNVLRKYGEKSVKKTLTIPGWLNASCEERGINFSKVLQEALIARLQAR